jgi:hypothetical protein
MTTKVGFLSFETRTLADEVSSAGVFGILRRFGPPEGEA